MAAHGYIIYNSSTTGAKVGAGKMLRTLLRRFGQYGDMTASFRSTFEKNQKTS